MKKLIKIIVMMAVCLGFVGSVASAPVYAAKEPEMNVLKMCEGKSDSEAVMCVLRLVVNIMTFGVGILGTIGVIISGIQYISSQGDPGKMTKAKNRIIQIVIGLVIYAVMYAGLYFLVPGFNADDLEPSTSSGGGTSTSQSEGNSGSGHSGSKHGF